MLRARHLLILAAALAAGACQKEPPPEPGMTGPHPKVVLETSMGRIVLELDRTKAPQTVDNIVPHVNRHFYDGLIVDQVIKGNIIRTGQYLPDGTERRTSAPPVPPEADNGLKNVRGAVALSRHLEPESGTVQFFINVTDNPRFDFTDKSVQGWGFTVFGKVADGMDVVDRIAAVPTLPNGVPVTPVVIKRAYVDTTVAAPAAPAKEE
ncbi:MAG: peptidylprolyl isomerase [Gemmatimonadales bacterium]|jgi:cyclophilin family peptidyl-prolyl cis-trans isomerase